MTQLDFDNAKTEIIYVEPAPAQNATVPSFSLSKFEEEKSDREIIIGVGVLEELQIRGVQYTSGFGNVPESIHLTVVLKNILYTSYAFFEEMQKAKKVPDGLRPVFVMGDLQRYANEHLKVHVYFLDEADYKIWRTNNLSLGRVVKEIRSKKTKMIGI